ncbi:MAG: peptidylprolyl isomerase [Kofleriaceae bacterium]
MKLGALILTVASATAFAAPSPTKPPPAAAGTKVIVDRVAAVVNDQVILVSELDIRMMPLRAEAAKIADQGERDRRLAKLGLSMLDEMINDELVVQAAVAAKLTVEPEELKSAVDYIKKENKLDDKALEEAMKAQGITVANLKNDLLRQRAINQLVGPKVSVSEDEVKSAYDEMTRRSASVTAVNVSHILFALPEHATEQQQNEAKQRAQAALDRLKAGADFAALANELTDDTGTKTTGGMLGWIDAGTALPEWEPVVFAMEKGDVRGPVAGPKGLYILYANDLKRTQLQPYAAMKEQIGSNLRHKALAKQTKVWIEELRKKAYIDIKLS